MGFNRVGCLPTIIILSMLDDDVGTEAIFRQHKAKWHDSCKLQFNKTTLQRAEKRKSHIENNTDVSKKFSRQSVEEEEALHAFTGVMFWKQGQTDCMGHVECL